MTTQLLPNSPGGLDTINLLKPSQFKLTIRRDQYPHINYFCQSVQHPGMNLSAAELPYQRVAPGIPMPGDKLSFGELSAIVLADEDLKGYHEMYAWMRRLVETNFVAPDKAYNRDKEQIPSHTDIVLSILSSHNNKVKRFTYKHCVPTSLGDLAFDATIPGTEAITFPISFRFAYFEIED